MRCLRATNEYPTLSIPIAAILIHFVKCMAPSKWLQQLLSVGIEAGDVEGGRKSFYAVQPPRLAVVDRVCRDEIRYLCVVRLITTSIVQTMISYKVAHEGSQSSRRVLHPTWPMNTRQPRRHSQL